MSQDATGQQIGNFQLVRRLGAGGMGAVYEALHPALGRRVAIKLMHGRLSATDSLVERFFREGRALAGLKHPGLPEVYDLGRTPDGQMYMVMELLEGESLAARLRRRPPRLAEVRQWLAAIGQVVGFMHGRGVVHRDLKPDNLFLCADGRLVVLDFGVAKLMQEPVRGPNLSRSGVVMGTPHYMAPEQVEAQKPVDARADIYALGCVLTELATGSPPFMGTSEIRIMSAHLEAPPPPPSTRRPWLGPALDQVIVRALAKSPADRYPDVASLVAAADEALADAEAREPETVLPDTSAVATAPTAVSGDGEAVAPTAPPPSPPPSASRGEQPVPATASPSQPPRSGKGRVAAVVAGLLLLGGALVAWRLWPRPLTLPVVAVIPQGPGRAPPPVVEHLPSRARALDDVACKAAIARLHVLLQPPLPDEASVYAPLARSLGSADPTSLCQELLDGDTPSCLEAASNATAAAACLDETAVRRCEGGESSACRVAGYALVERLDFERARRAAERACSAADGDGCTTLALLQLNGQGGPPDLTRARQTLAKAIALGSVEGQAQQALMLGEGWGSAPDPRASRTQLKAVCERVPEHWSCAVLAHMELAGEGGHHDQGPGEKRARRLCVGGVAEACELLAGIDRGPARSADLERARTLHEAYRKRSVRAIRGLARVLLATAQLDGRQQAVNLLDGGCYGAHDRRACRALGVALVSGAVPLELARAQKANDMACEAGLRAACSDAACQKDAARPDAAPERIASCKESGALGPVGAGHRDSRPSGTRDHSPAGPGDHRQPSWMDL